MQEDTIAYDSLNARPLPAWLIARKEGSTLKPEPEMKIRNDKTIDFSIAVTIGFLLLSVLLMTIVVKRKQNKN
jgi:hypothetical protein